MTLFGEYFRDIRLKRGLTLRAYCSKTKEDPAFISRLEHGIIKPPKEEAVLRRLATSLGLTEGNQEWNDFHQYADIAAGRIPAKVMANEELVKHLPIFFRTIANERFPDDKLEDFIEFIRKMYQGGGE